MMDRRTFLALGSVAALAACAGEAVWAPEEAVTRARYEPPGDPTITLFTMISNRSGAGGHLALMIDGEQRLLFDPAGTWRHPAAPERNDVIYGMNPQMLDFYTDYHARETYHIVVQELDVTPEVAARLSQLVQEYGAVPKAQCTISITRILQQVPGFENIRTSWFPRRAMDMFAEFPGVRTRRIFDDDSDDNREILGRQARTELRLQRAAEVEADGS